MAVNARSNVDSLAGIGDPPCRCVFRFVLPPLSIAALEAISNDSTEYFVLPRRLLVLSFVSTFTMNQTKKNYGKF